MGRVRTHDKFIGLLNQDKNRLFGFLYSLVRNTDDTEEVFQRACLVMWSKFDQFNEDTSFLNWACQVGKYEALNYLRSKRRGKLVFSESLQDELIAIEESLVDSADDSRYEALESCMGKLDESDGSLIRLRYRESKSVQSIASLQGRPVRSVHNSLLRIRRALLGCIERALSQDQQA